MEKIITILTDPITILLIIVLFVLIWLVTRELKCWYWKINEKLEAQEEQTELLKEILEELKKITDEKSTPE